MARRTGRRARSTAGADAVQPLGIASPSGSGSRRPGGGRRAPRPPTSDRGDRARVRAPGPHRQQRDVDAGELAHRGRRTARCRRRSRSANRPRARSRPAARAVRRARSSARRHGLDRAADSRRSPATTRRPRRGPPAAPRRPSRAAPRRRPPPGGRATPGRSGRVPMRDDHEVHVARSPRSGSGPCRSSGPSRRAGTDRSGRVPGDLEQDRRMPDGAEPERRRPGRGVRRRLAGLSSACRTTTGSAGRPGTRRSRDGWRSRVITPPSIAPASSRPGRSSCRRTTGSSRGHRASARSTRRSPTVRRRRSRRARDPGSLPRGPDARRRRGSDHRGNQCAVSEVDEVVDVRPW